MKKSTKILTIICAGICGAFVGTGSILLLKSAWGFADAFLNNRVPQDIEYVGIIGIAVFCAAIGAVLCALDLPDKE